MLLRRATGMAACFGVFACVTGRALAHEPPFGTGVYARGAQLVVRNTRGLVSTRSAERQEFRFLCNEALGVAEYDAPSVIVRDDQSLLVGSSTGLRRVSRDLCAVESSDALPSMRVNALRPDPHDSAHIYAATDLGLYESRDQGESFTQLDPHAFDSLEVPVSAQGEVFAAGKLASAAGQPQAYFAHWQADHALTLQQFALDPNEYGVELFGSDARRVFAVAHAYLGTQYEDRFLVSVDGAQNWQSPVSAAGISAFLIDADTGMGLLGSSTGLWRTSDFYAPTTQLQAAAVSCLARGAERLYMCDGAGASGGVSESRDDGEHWRSVLRWDQVTGLADCPAERPAVALCQAAWDDWQREIPRAQTNRVEPTDAGGGAETAEPPPSTTQGCAALSGTHRSTSLFGWLALCLSWLRIRRWVRNE